MTDSPAQILQQWLVDAGLGVLSGASSAVWPVFHDAEPDAPDDCVTVYDTDGIDEGRTQWDGKELGPEGFQIRVRSRSHAVGWPKAEAIRSALSAPPSVSPSTYGARVTVSPSGLTYVIQCVVRVGNVIRLGKAVPNSRRNLFTINGLIRVIEA